MATEIKPIEGPLALVQGYIVALCARLRQEPDPVIISCLETQAGIAKVRVALAEPHDIGYEDVEKIISGLPMTWLPAILIHAVATGYKKGCYQPGGAAVIATKIEKRLKERGDI